MNKITFLLLSSVVILGCSAMPFFAPTLPTETGINGADCSNISMTDEDVEATLQYGRELLAKGDWEQSYTVSPEQVYVSYISAELGAVVFVYRFAFCSGQTELKDFIDEEYISIALSNYEKYSQVSSCEKDKSLLFQLTAFNNETDYDVKVWFTALDIPNRAQEVMLVFQQSDPASMEKYSAYFFPEFISC